MRSETARKSVSRCVYRHQSYACVLKTCMMQMPTPKIAKYAQQLKITNNKHFYNYLCFNPINSIFLHNLVAYCTTAIS